MWKNDVMIYSIRSLVVRDVIVVLNYSRITFLCHVFGLDFGTAPPPPNRVSGTSTLFTRHSDGPVIRKKNERNRLKIVNRKVSKRIDTEKRIYINSK